ncbi:hypothetical protein TNCV_85451 [Trichonephila clavipes]|nr:hypothetical protein TNCV_85451 [Trichonephila clavipes]
MQPDLRKLICEHIIRVLQHRKDVEQKQRICIKHDFMQQEALLGAITPDIKLAPFVLSTYPVEPVWALSRLRSTSGPPRHFGVTAFK